MTDPMDESQDPAAGPEPAVSAEPAAALPSAGWTELSLALMVLIWGVNFAVVKRALVAFEPLAFTAVRYLIASLFVFAVLRARGPVRRPAREDLPRLLWLGLIGNVLYPMAFILGLDRTRAGDASLILALMPVFVLLLDVRAGARHGRRAWVGAAISLVGVALVSGSGQHLIGASALVGNLILVSASFFWAVYTLGAKPMIQRYGSVETTAWTLWVGAAGIFLLGIPALGRQEWRIADPWAWYGLLYSAILSIGLAYLIWYRGVARLGGARTAIYSNLTPVVGMAAGALLLGERATVPSLLGAAMVLGGVMLVRSGPGPGRGGEVRVRA